MLVENPWFASVTTDVVASTSDQIPNRSTPIERIKNLYSTKSAQAVPITCTIVVAAFQKICFWRIGICISKEGKSRGSTALAGLANHKKSRSQIYCPRTGVHRPVLRPAKDIHVPTSAAKFTMQNEA